MARVLVGPLARLESCGFAGNLNTGMWYVRSTPLAQDMLAFIATIRYTHKADSRVRGWGFNGGTMIAFHNATIVANTALVPAKLINTYLDAWTPGDFVVHFAGHYPKAAAFKTFLAKAPPDTWPGYLTP